VAALFHDIGKLGVPDAILLKPGRLDPAERAVVEEHPDRGAEIVGRLASLREAVPAIRYHHERWDGRGYPTGLAGEELPLEAAIVGLADAWDAMVTDRPYRKALSLEEAFAQLHEHRGTQFHPDVVDAFFVVATAAPAEILPPARGRAEAQPAPS
jgi:HD-GYP domain-containing protein (c-di-GMP phosphodiesterase class II)